MKTKIFNLIILDESGSMGSIHQEAISGCNETIQSIREAQQKNANTQEQYVTVVLFSGSTECNLNYLRENVPAGKVEELQNREYNPHSCTPLYDAIGISVSQLHKTIANSADTIGMVTIITDGYENASEKFTLASVQALITHLKEEGWIFSFIGADIDVQKIAIELNITSYMAFNKTHEDTERMFREERNSRAAVYERINQTASTMEHCSESERRHAYSMNNTDYFEGGRITPERIDSLAVNEIFVFGSDISGNHSGGAARQAYERFGAVMGQAEGIQGKSYAIPTTGVTTKEMAEAIRRFIKFADQHRSYHFLVTRIGCGHGGYTDDIMAKFFEPARHLPNVWLPQSFRNEMNHHAM
jgi:uncharacterized protein YegL